MADDDTTEVLRKADALMRRTRVFVAGAKTQLDALPAQEDDLPVLTEVVPEHEAALATAPPHMQHHLDALRDELSLWLEQELPNAVLKVTDGLADQLTGELTDLAEKNLLPRLIACLDGTTPRPGSET